LSKGPFDEVSGAWEIVPRVVVVDDSASSRAVIAEMLEEGGCDVVGRAMDGGMALRMVLDLDPDVVTCDLEMPRMDGFTFIRVLSQRKKTPVIVVTSDARPEAALQALDLGARDFVVKPGQGRARDLHKLASSLVGKVRGLAAESAKKPQWSPPTDVPAVPERALVVIGASTGGPSALKDVLRSLPPTGFPPVLIAQHMPERFTEAFAARLARTTGLDIAEAKDGEEVRPNTVRVGPGGKNLEVEVYGTGLALRLREPDPDDRHVPNVDRLFISAAAAVGSGLLGVVLTGMGRDGTEGARHLAKVGAPIWTESRSTAVIHGMPDSAAEAHGSPLRLPLDELSLLFGRVLGRGGGAS